MKTATTQKASGVAAKKTVVRAASVLPAASVKGQIVTPAKPAPAAKQKAAPIAKPAKVPAPAKAKPAVHAAKTAETVKPAAPEKAPKPKEAKKKNKVVRDSFTMPEADYAKLAALKARCVSAGVAVKKSELLRAGLQVLETLPAKKLLAIIAGIENVKTGRPAKI